MSILATLIGAGVGLFFLFIAYRKWDSNRATQKRDLEIFEKAKPLIEALESQQEVDIDLVQKLAEDAAVRTFLFVLLDQHGKLDLFPESYNNFVSSAEAALSYWLLHPNELGSRPKKIKFVKKVKKKHQIKEKVESLTYYVFKFIDQVDTTGEESWTAGVAGPYLDRSNPYDFVPGTFSTFEAVDAKSPEEHASWVHEMCIEKKLF